MREKYDHYIEPMQGVKYGVLDGIDYSNTVIFVKLPSDTGLYGYNNKYYTNNNFYYISLKYK